MRSVPIKRSQLHFLEILLLGTLVLTGACSMQRMAISQTAAALKKAMPAFEREWDYELAAQALPSNLKMIEGLLEVVPDNEDLLEMAAKAYTSFALVVLEDQLEQLEEGSDAADRLGLRTKEMFLRGHRYGLRLIDQRVAGFSKAFRKGREELAQALKECEKEDTFALVWVGLPLASAINVGRDDIALIALIPRVKAVMRRALELDETYYHAAPHLIMGGLLGGITEHLGGKPDEAKKHFEKALLLNKRRFLLHQVMYAKTLAVQLQDRKLFKSLLEEVLQAKLEIYPQQKLANVVAKRKARRLLAKIDELFD